VLIAVDVTSDHLEHLAFAGREVSSQPKLPNQYDLAAFRIDWQYADRPAAAQNVPRVLDLGAVGGQQAQLVAFIGPKALDENLWTGQRNVVMSITQRSLRRHAGLDHTELCSY
jgi:hypothetical protein